MKTKLIAILFVGLMAAGVCLAGEQEVSYPAANTPQQALANLRQACLAGDKAGMLACMEASDSEMELISMAVDMGLAIMAYREKVIEVFGEEAVEEFGMISHGPLEELVMMTEYEVAIDADGKTGCTVVPEDSSAEELGLVCIDGEWLVTMPDMPADEDEIEQTMVMLAVMTDAVNGQIARIDDEGMTVEQLSEDLGEAMEAAFAAAMEEEEAESEALDADEAADEPDESSNSVGK